MQPAAEHAIRIDGLVKRYGTVTAVENLSLSVPRGCMYGFLGPNGSGKSTTIGCLTGLLEPTAGTIEILGQRFNSENVAVKRRMGVMPETLGLFEPLYAQEFLAFTARMYGLDEDTARTRVTELLAALELTDARKPLADYSTGMRKRVAFAAAVIHSPDVLFLDEPFESIDPAGVALLKQWLRRFTEQGRTVFVTTHVLDTVERLCQQVAIVTKPGKLVWEGDITALAHDRAIEFDGQQFRALEALFLHLTGEKYADLKWL
ncbi:MAG TPA: ABC transporter ATP-binding protein [Bryobacteraceae bacterium]|jgi:ABC-2 type transport system ATP-binding protein|nr:ABC transporter ATP-binding protein [Bryobacteraceae bacterium]